MTRTLIVYFKELKDILRDRRTIISMVLVPLLFYPIVTIGLGKLISSQIEKSQTTAQPILVLPAQTAPELIDLLTSDSRLYAISPDSVRASLLRVASADSSLNPATINALFESVPGGISESEKHAIYYAAVSREWIKAVVEFPPDLTAGADAGDSQLVRIFVDDTDVDSDAAGSHIRAWALTYRDSLVDIRLGEAGIDRGALKPFWVASVDIAPAAKQSGRFLAMILPYMLMILTFTGGLYPALDITAGEKERNTLETLLVAPVARWELAAGKFLTVLTAGLVTMVLATTSMVFSMKLGAMQFSGGGTSAIQIGLSVSAVTWLVLLMIPMATLFSALLITVSIAARSFKEAQSYTTPILMSVIMPAMITFVPGIKLTWGLTAVPVVNLCLALKDVLMGVHEPLMILSVLGFTTLYAVFMLFVAARIFQRESVLFRT